MNLITGMELSFLLSFYQLMKPALAIILFFQNEF